MNKEETPALDDSRVHPSFYDTATCLAQVATKPSSDLDPKDTRAVDRAMRSPHSVEALDLHVSCSIGSVGVMLLLMHLCCMHMCSWEAPV